MQQSLSVTKSVDFKVTWQEEELVNKETRSDDAQVGGYGL